MTNTVRRLAVLFIACLTFTGFCGPAVFAGGTGGGPGVQFTASASSVTANGSSTITFTVYTLYYQCDGQLWSEPVCASPTEVPIGDRDININISGSGNTTGGTHTNSYADPAVTTGSDGKAQFTLVSTVAESKTLKTHYREMGYSQASEKTLTVNFTQQQTSTPKTTTPKTTTPKPVEPTPPETPKVATVTVDNQPVEQNKAISLSSDQPLTLTGTTVANGIVKLYIFSTLREVSVTADSTGKWEYRIEGLEPGAHHVEAEVTDPATNKTSSRATLAEFTVVEPVAQIATTSTPVKPAKKFPLVPVFAAVGLIVVGATGALWWFVLRKKHLNTLPTQDNGQTPSASDDQPKTEEQ